MKIAKVVSMDNLRKAINQFESCEGAKELFNLLKKKGLIKEETCP